jgi:hypothetical protein
MPNKGVCALAVKVGFGYLDFISSERSIGFHGHKVNALIFAENSVFPESYGHLEAPEYRHISRRSVKSFFQFKCFLCLRHLRTP